MPAPAISGSRNQIGCCKVEPFCFQKQEVGGWYTTVKTSFHCNTVHNTSVFNLAQIMGSYRSPAASCSAQRQLLVRVQRIKQRRLATSMRCQHFMPPPQLLLLCWISRSYARHSVSADIYCTLPPKELTWFAACRGGVSGAVQQRLRCTFTPPPPPPYFLSHFEPVLSLGRSPWSQRINASLPPYTSLEFQSRGLDKHSLFNNFSQLLLVN